jgi:hypothetical protein
MTLFDESFLEPTKLLRDWIVAPGMSARNGVLTFTPGHDMGWCAGLTRRNDFRDFSLKSDVRVVSRTVGLVLRAAGPDQYYMVQFDLANNPSVVWFHTFTPKVDEGYRLDLVPSGLVPRTGVWHRMNVVARGHSFEVFLSEEDGPLQHCASWQDPWQTYREGAVGVWAHGGEAGEYRAFRVDELSSVDA